MKPTRPALRYHGGKWLLADWIISHFPQHRVYVEPFGGGGSVLLKKPRSYAEIYNDLDGEIVNLFTVYRDRGEELMRAVSLTPFARDEFVLSYKMTADTLEQARRTLVRSFMGFGSNSHNQATGFRANSNRSGTTPAKDWANLPASMLAIIHRMRGVIIENRDAITVMEQHDAANALHYVDPPYLPETRDAGGDYRYEMTEQQHVDLAGFLKTVKGSVVLSGYPSPLYESLYKDWHRIDRNAFADGAAKRVEVLWIKGELNQKRLDL